MKEINITSQAVPSGRGCPSWLFDKLQQESLDGVVIIHPTPQHRSMVLEELDLKGAVVHPHLHVTYEGLLRQLHSDFRLPTLPTSEIQILELIHRRLKQEAETHRYPLLHSGAHVWSLTKTKRVLNTLKKLIQHSNKWKWETDPGFDAVLKSVLTLERQEMITFPFLQEFHIHQHLLTAEQIPFHLQFIRGFIILNQPPDYTPIANEILNLIARWKPIHQLITPGSFRLGFNGRYVADQPFDEHHLLPFGCDEVEPMHSTPFSWKTEVGVEKETSYMRVLLANKQHTFETTVQAIAEYRQQHKGSIFIIDPLRHEHQDVWHQYLHEVGLVSSTESVDLLSTSLVQQFFGLLNISFGVHAWSFSNLLRCIHSTIFGMKDSLFEELTHPSNSEWKHRFHEHVLERCCTQNHILGGPGVLARWRGSLQNMKPVRTRFETITEQEIEETQWALGCVAAMWHPLMSEEDRFISELELEGSISGQILPLPSSPTCVFTWFFTLIQKFDWDSILSHEFEARKNMTAFELLIKGVHDLHELTSVKDREQRSVSWFSERLLHIAQHQHIKLGNRDTSEVKILTPDEAFGLESDLLVLTHLDLESWSMRQPTIPWIDERSKVELGFLGTDDTIRKSRHHLRHLLNSAHHVVLLDTSIEEGGEPAAPVSEWLSSLSEQEMIALSQPFDFLKLQTEEHEATFWDSWFEEDTGIEWILPALFQIKPSSTGYQLMKKGIRPRNIRQNAGLEFINKAVPNQQLHSPYSFKNRMERELHLDRIQRQPRSSQLNKGQVMDWDLRKRRTSISDLKAEQNLMQAQKGPAGGPTFPHLGVKINGTTFSPYIDPTPLPPAHLLQPEFEPFSGTISSALERKSWSPSRLQTWMQCPRKGWAQHFLEIEDPQSEISEDIDSLQRGDLIHELLASIIGKHGVIAFGKESEHPMPLQEGPLPTLSEAWAHALTFLSEHASWLEQNHAISVHRCRHLLGVTPNEWRSYLAGELDLTPSGSLGNLLEKLYEMESSAPTAIEWRVGDEQSAFIDVHQSEESPLFINGYADRIDVICLSDEQEDMLIEHGYIDEVEHTSAFPMQSGEEIRPAQRYVIVRDIKTVRGPTVEKQGMRHFKGLFREVQLALYARAWEVTHPNDRVVGVGISEVGDKTINYVEIDSSAFPKGFTLDGIGHQTSILPAHYPEKTDDEQTQPPFRVWMEERIHTGLRAVEAAHLGFVNPTPGKHCRYCPVKQSCSVSNIVGGEW